MRRGLALGSLVAVLAGLPAAARGAAPGAVVVPPPIVVEAPPLAIVPAVPAVRYAPTLDVDVFIYGGAWFYPYRGQWFTSRTYVGPWRPIPVAAVPRPVLRVPVQYYKVPPGHLRHAGRPGHPPGRARGRSH